MTGQEEDSDDVPGRESVTVGGESSALLSHSVNFIISNKMS